MNNLLTDIAGVSVGHADDAALASGVTAIIFDKPAVASIDVRGGGPGTREDALLDPVSTVEAIDAITLSGGSAFGLEAGGGVQAWLHEQGRGFRIRDAVIPHRDAARSASTSSTAATRHGDAFRPIVTSAMPRPRRRASDFALGSVGAGLGVTTATLKGGLGSASAATQTGVKVAAIAVVNAVGSVTVGDGPWFWLAVRDRRRIRRPRHAAVLYV